MDAVFIALLRKAVRLVDIHVEGAFADAVRLTAAGQEIVERQLIFAQNAARLADADGRRGLLENGVAELRHVGR